jgi:hypothetical protein
MSGKPNFNAVLQIPDVTAKPEPGEEPPGPGAAGPVADGDKLMWIYVWIVQNGPEDDPWAAAADGESPEEDSARKKWQTSTRRNKKWKIETEMTHDSDAFREGPAIATAMALVKRGDGSTDVDWWTEAIHLEAPRKRPRAN